MAGSTNRLATPVKSSFPVWERIRGPTWCANGTASLDILWERGAFRLEHPSFGTYGEQLDRHLDR